MENITLTKEQALKVLTCLGHTIFKVDNDLINTREDVAKLIDHSEDIAECLAEQLNIDLLETYVGYKELEQIPYKELNKAMDNAVHNTNE